jgi:hypothetical protein
MSSDDPTDSESSSALAMDAWGSVVKQCDELRLCWLRGRGM